VENKESLSSGFTEN